MKKFIYVFIFILTHKLFAQESYYDVKYIARDTTQFQVSTIAYWNKGDKYRYHVVQKEIIYESDSIKSEKSIFDSEIELLVLDSTEKSYELEWRIVKNLSNSNLKDNEFDEINKKYCDLRLLYKTDETGALLEYHTLNEVNQLANEITNFIKKKIADTLKFDSPEKKNLFDNYLALYLSPNALVEKLFTNPVSHLHNMYGYGSFLNDTLSFKMKTKNSINGELIENDGLIYVASIDSTNEVQFIQELYPDKATLNKLTLDVLKKSHHNQNEVNELEKNFSFDAEFYNQYFIDLNNGVANFVRVTKSVFLTDKKTNEGNLQRRDVLTIERIE